MNKFFALFFIVITFILVSCDKEVDEDVNPSCELKATVRDLTGLDRCGFVFELEDGTRLEPVRIFFCGTPGPGPELQEDPLYDFEFIDGKKVKISYHLLNDYGSYCMVGPLVRITCLTEERQAPAL